VIYQIMIGGQGQEAWGDFNLPIHLQNCDVVQFGSHQAVGQKI
jgi:hypothetical protein